VGGIGNNKATTAHRPVKQPTWHQSDSSNYSSAQVIFKGGM